MLDLNTTTESAHLGIADCFLPPDLHRQADPLAAAAGPSRPNRRLLLPGPGRHPDFDEVARIATIAALFRQAVCVLCLDRATEEAWQRRPLPPESQAARLDILSYRCASPANWQHFLSRKAYDLVVFHGAEAALNAAQLTPMTLTWLVQAADAALVMVV